MQKQAIYPAEIGDACGKAKGVSKGEVENEKYLAYFEGNFNAHALDNYWISSVWDDGSVMLRKTSDS